MQTVAIQHQSDVTSSRPPNDSGGDSYTLRLVVVLAKRKRLLALAAALGTIAGLAFAFLIPPQYASITRIMPPAQNQSLATSVLGQLGPLAGLAQRDFGLKSSSELYVQLLKSRTVE